MMGHGSGPTGNEKDQETLAALLYRAETYSMSVIQEHQVRGCNTHRLRSVDLADCASHTQVGKYNYQY